MNNRLRGIGFACVLLLAMASAAAPAAARGRGAAASTAAAPVTVVLDGNYPPYVFRDESGELRGILVDLWGLWSARTGVAVDLQAFDWSEAQRRMATGRADVIDTIFQTPERERSLAFSEPYATLDVSIFFHRDLSGIADIASLRGFTVGVKAGDACIDWLAEHDITAVRAYPNYGAMIDALVAHESLVACIDNPPALYLAYKKGVEGLIRHTAPLYSGRFHWAVNRGDEAFLQQVRDGFSRIGPEERRAVEERWLGIALNGRTQALREMARYLPFAAAAAALLLAWNWALRRRVAAKTASLSRALANLAVGEERFRAIFDNVNDAIFVHDIESMDILAVNRRAREMFRLGDAPEAAFAVEDLSEGRHPYCREAAQERFRLAASGAPQIFEWHARTLDGEFFWTEVSMRLARLDGERERMLVVARDISERKAAQARMEFLAHHDALTGLPNRRLLQDRVEQAIALSDRLGRRMAMLFLDLDQFKTINDSLGHPAGDELLRLAAARLRAALRESDTVCRLGGDEFVVVLNHVRDTESVTEAMAHIQEAIALPVTLHGTAISSTASIGVVLYPDDGGDFDTLLKKADTAMYHAKQSGRSTYRFFTEQMNVEAMAHLDLRGGLQRALERGEFRLFFQPLVALEDGRLVGAEALIRWQHPERGLVSPAEFIPIAEESGLIVPIGDWVLREACRQAAAWPGGRNAPGVAVNLSAVQFRRDDLEARVVAALSESGLAPERLELEITESLLMHNVDAVMGLTRRLGSLGVRLSIDDFGTGYSSLAYLKRFRVDRLKIDRSFVSDICRNDEDVAIVRAIVQMAHSLKLTVVAEGVETEEAAALLRLEQCDLAQGYLFGHPMPGADFSALLSRR
ncbi:EAL domain-containing protein [Oleispirillum naphthae]|uniref:EAL domain-containing protein n=1 Tax=Oleispirillum naphthae TaxID=2838853 RepID=UPI00308259C9